MGTKTWTILALAVGYVGFLPADARAQTPTPTPAMRATLEASHLSGLRGSVSVTPQGAGSMVHVDLSGQAVSSESLTLMKGSECQDVVRRSATVAPLKPITGHVSNTLVAIPFSAFSSGKFVIDVRSTARAQQVAACARL